MEKNTVLHHSSRPPLLVIIGPTASGKSAVAVDCALRYGGEVISADSRQVYAQLQQTTGKITREEMKGVPHHLLAAADAGETYNVHQYIEQALPCVEEIYARKTIPILAGGTGFYIDSLLFTNSTASVPSDPAYREKLHRRGKEAMRRELREKDNEAYERIDVENPRRLVRALEVIRALGSFKKQKREQRYPYRMIGIQHSKPHLYERIERRLDARFDLMIKEVQQLLNDGIDPLWLDDLGLECRHIVRMLTQSISKEETRSNLLRAIIAYAKRQETWWKRYPEARWFHENEKKTLYRHLDGNI